MDRPSHPTQRRARGRGCLALRDWFSRIAASRARPVVDRDRTSHRRRRSPHLHLDSFRSARCARSFRDQPRAAARFGHSAHPRRDRVRAGEGVRSTPRAAPVAMVLVIDTSGSMAGRKIEDARPSGARHARRDATRRHGQRGSVREPSRRPRAARSSCRHSRRSAPTNRAPERRGQHRHRQRSPRRRSRSRLDARRPHRPHRARHRWARHFGRPAQHGLRGRAHRGEPRFHRSALGIGTDFDDAYLAGISDAGRGNYEFLRDSSALSRFLSKELREALARACATSKRVSRCLPTRASVTCGALPGKATGSRSARSSRATSDASSSSLDVPAG